jgi:hypothetical protein
MKSALVSVIGAALALCSCSNKNSNPSAQMTPNVIERLDLSRYPATAPARTLELLFIHHSCGGQLLADPGPEEGSNCIYRTHPNGGGLRAKLERNSYRVHEVSYSSALGERTDIFDWLPKFRGRMDMILAADGPDRSYPDNSRNQIVVFKSCFPNNRFVAEGIAPGNPAGPELTVRNAQAAYEPLLEEFRKHSNVLFVCVTAPPLAPKGNGGWKSAVKRLLGREVTLESSARLARQFNNWLSSRDGWLKSYPLNNVVVFDYYDVLTGCGESDCSLYPTGDGSDSHPSRAGNEKAAEVFVPFLNRAVHRLGVAQQPGAPS